jgi:hypothetical protein
LTVTTATDKQGPTLVRWAAIEACQLTRPDTKLAADRARIIANRGRNIGVVAAARKLLTYVYYSLRDGDPCAGQRDRVSGLGPSRARDRRGS